MTFEKFYKSLREGKSLEGKSIRRKTWDKGLYPRMDSRGDIPLGAVPETMGGSEMNLTLHPRRAGAMTDPIRGEGPFFL